MERIRKALDLARLERARIAEGPEVDVPDLGAPLVDAPRIDNARVERPRLQRPRVEAPPIDPAPSVDEFPPEPPELLERIVSPRSIVYSQTKVFTPQPEVLERNRVLDPGSNESAAIAFRMLRTQVLQRMAAKGWRSLAIFSPGPNDGKTTTAINLATSIASDHRHTVLLVDLDFKRPTVASRLGLVPELGSDDALRGSASVGDCMYHPDVFDRLVVIPARAPMLQSSELLAGPRSREIVQELRARYPDRIIIFDLPPVLSADDAVAFSPLVECGLVVAAEGRTRRTDLLRTMELLRKVPLVGTVLNRAAEAVSGY